MARTRSASIASPAPATTETATTSRTTRKRKQVSEEVVVAEALAVEVVDKRNSRRKKQEVKEEPDVIEEVATVLDEEEGPEDEGGEDDDNNEDDEFGVFKMNMKEIKEQLRERTLSTNGTLKVIAKRLVDRLTKEKDPEYKPKPKGRYCKWCQAPMKKRRTRKGDQFYGCSAFPHCQYTTSLSGYAKPKREHLKGKYATFYNPNFDYERYY